MRADIHDGQEHKRSIHGPDTEAQDQSSPSVTFGLQHTAGPYSWVIFDRDAASSMFRHVGCTPESGSKIKVVAIVRVHQHGALVTVNN